MIRPSTANAATRGENATFSVSYTHRLRFTHDVFAADNPTFLNVFEHQGSSPLPILVFVDQGLVDASPHIVAKMEDYFRTHQQCLTLVDGVRTVPGGEPAKNDRTALDSVLHDIHQAGLCRQSYVVAVGGGAVLDIVGFAAGTAHRGIRLVRLPSTTLSQADSGVGVKNGINTFGKKNYWGTFGVPWAVINDDSLLATLSDRDWRCGFSEAVKVALIKDCDFFDLIAKHATAIRNRDYKVAAPIIERSCQLHYQHIIEGGDPFELTEARPLDFGHWSAHKLEQLTNFTLKHGEAVATGVALDTTYSAMMGYLRWPEAQAAIATLQDLGFVLYDEKLQDYDQLFAGIDEFREHLGGELTIPMLQSIGCCTPVNHVDYSQMRRAIEYLAIHAK